jgi:hypothetical protein
MDLLDENTVDSYIYIIYIYIGGGKPGWKFMEVAT